jgi:hypothetical protein
MHAQMSLEAMFSSLAECRMGLQRRIVLVESNEAQRSIAGVIGEVDFIERRGVLSISGDCIAVDEINAAKTRIIRALLHLRDMAEVSFVLPLSTTEEVFFTEEEATSPPRELQ